MRTLGQTRPSLTTPPERAALDNTRRLAAFQEALRGHHLAGAVLAFSRDIYYYTGLALPAWLMVRQGDWRLFLRRGLETLPEPCPIERERITAGLDLAGACAQFFPDDGAGERIGLELDMLSMLEGRRYQKALGSRELVDVSPLVMGMRLVKDLGEVASLERACAALAVGHQGALTALRPGVSELAWAAAIENAQRLAGHQGVFFFRHPDVLMGRGPVASGPGLTRTTGTVFTATGAGLHPSLPAGPSARVFEPGDLVLCDIPACREGYHADMSRMYALGSPPARAAELCDALRQISDGWLAGLRPGMTCQEACALAHDLAAGLGLADSFQRLPSGAFIPYVGHGVGLELNEPPLITPKNPARLAAGMTLALELHLLHPGGYLLKLEDTLHLTEQGGRLLTPEGRGLNAGQ
ncbi:MAG: aminopeptidase P family protein [Desulfarculus sp.]|nr:aminopeptidase P family protein [Desulfarculus sp.]